MPDPKGYKPSPTLKFGNEEHISIRKQRKQRKLAFDVDESCHYTEWKVCEDCYSRVPKKVIKISEAFQYTCDSCKKEFIEYANTRGVVLLTRLVKCLKRENQNAEGVKKPEA